MNRKVTLTRQKDSVTMATSKVPLEDRLIERMYELEDSYRSILEARAKNRMSLRNLLDEDMLTTEQGNAVLSIYPERKSRGSEDESDVNGASE